MYLSGNKNKYDVVLQSDTPVSANLLYFFVILLINIRQALEIVWYITSFPRGRGQMGLVTLLCGYSAQSSGHMLAKFVRVHIDIYTKRAISQSQIYLTFTSGVGQDEVTGCQSGVIFKHETNRFCGDHNCIIIIFFSPGNSDHPQPSLWWPTPSDGPLPTIQHKAGTHKTVEVQTSLGHFLKGMTYRTWSVLVSRGLYYEGRATYPEYVWNLASLTNQSSPHSATSAFTWKGRCLQHRTIANTEKSPGSRVGIL